MIARFNRERVRVLLERWGQKPSMALMTASLLLGGLLIALMVFSNLWIQEIQAENRGSATVVKGLPQTLPQDLPGVSTPLQTAKSTTSSSRSSEKSTGQGMDVTLIQLNGRPTLRAIDVSYGMYCLADLPLPNATIVWSCVALRPNR